MKKTYNILGISGSLRTASLNHLFLRTMAEICPKNISFEIYSGLEKLPFFNPDEDIESIQFPEVSRWRSAIAQADLILLVSPEYAHGVTGVIKNALDWIVSSGELTDKLVAFPNISIRTDLAQSQLAETLKVMGCVLVEDCSPCASVAAPYIFSDATESMLIHHPDIGARLKLLWNNIENTLSQPPSIV